MQFWSMQMSLSDCMVNPAVDTQICSPPFMFLLSMDAKLHFLVVNHSPQIRHIVVALLKELGYIKVSEANDGQMALRSIRTAKIVGAPINFVITDFAMPVMNGFDLTRAVRNNPDMSKIPILMITLEATIWRKVP